MTSLSVVPTAGRADVVVGVAGNITLKHFTLNKPERIVVGLDVEPSLRLLGHQVGTDEGVQVTVHYPVHIAYFEFSAVVLNQAVRLHNVGPDLAAEGNVQFAFVELVGVCLPFLDFQIVEARAEHLHGHLTILALTALRLTRNGDVRGDVRDAHSGLHFVDVLPALATGPNRVHAKILRPDVDLDAVVNFRNHKDRRKRSMATRGLIEGRNPHETMNAGFARKETVSIFTGKLDRRRLDAGFFSGSLIKNLGRHSPAFRPSQVHTEKDGSPILRFRPARAGLDGHDGVEVIGFSRKQRPGF